MLTVVVVDDIVALAVIATVYTDELSSSALFVALGLYAAVLLVRALWVRGGLVDFALGAAIWVALLEAGVEPVVVGLAHGPPDLGLPRGALGPSARHRAVPRVSRAADAGLRPIRRRRAPRGGIAERTGSNSCTTLGRAT